MHLNFMNLMFKLLLKKKTALFEPDVDAITEALESMRNNPGKNVHSFDCTNDQENSDLQDKLPNDLDPNKYLIMNNNLLICTLHSQMNLLPGTINIPQSTI